MPGGRTSTPWTAAGLVVLVAAVSPPVEDAVAGSLTAHMVQHLLLLVVAPALLATGRPLRALRSLVPTLAPATRLLDGVRRHAAAVVVAVAVAHAVAVTVWHVPALYDAAVGAVPLHLLEHATFVAVGWATWAVVRDAAGRHTGAAIAALFVVAAQGAALGAVLTFATRPLYTSTAADALADQQLAGLVMWVPGGAPYAAVAAALVVRAVATARPTPTVAVVRR